MNSVLDRVRLRVDARFGSHAVIPWLFENIATDRGEKACPVPRPSSMQHWRRGPQQLVFEVMRKLESRDQRRFYEIARGSMRESQAILMLAMKAADQLAAAMYRLLNPKRA
ncbi:MAG: hypothetical protein NTV34_11510 [Proteobacteria bacterium]|nr:hypothetical protein [Pseudomonadota bacterium]